MTSTLALFLVCSAFRVFEPSHPEADPIREAIAGSRQMTEVRSDRSTSLRLIQGEVTYCASLTPGRFLQVSVKDTQSGLETEFAGSVSMQTGSQGAFALRIPKANLELSCEVSEQQAPAQPPCHECDSSSGSR